MSSELCFLPATELAQRIRRKELSARELMQASLAQIERTNPTLNAIVSLYAEQAMQQALAADEKQARGAALPALHGLPVAHKDLFLTRGMRTTFGSPIFKDGFRADWMWKNPVDVALCSYGCNFQVFGRPENNKSDLWTWHNTHGQRRFADISDGTSKTIFLAERRMACGPDSGPNNSDTFGNAWGHPADDRYWPVFGRTNTSYTNDPNNPAYKTFFTPMSTPKPAQCIWQEYRAIGHSAGVVLCGMGDGSVRTVSTAVDTIPWSQSLLPKDGGNVELE